jgi:hypothetical protein
MDWARAIEINKAALTHIVAGLIALLKLQGNMMPERVPREVYRLALRILHPAESAVRRLIVIAARGLVVPPPSVRPMPQGFIRTSKVRNRIAFPLFDTRKRFTIDDETEPAATGGPRIRMVDDPDPRIPLFLPRPALRPRADQNDFVSAEEASRLGRRLMAVKRALDNVGAQARRLARWQARRGVMKRPGVMTPMRPGAPPGGRKESHEEVDLVLRECQALARYALENDTS